MNEHVASAPLRAGLALAVTMAVALAPLSGRDGGGLLAAVAAQQQAGPAIPGNGSGGTSGGVATPKGKGSSGITAGAGTGAGGQGASTGPGSVNQNRYGGTAPSVPEESEPPVATTTPPSETPVAQGMPPSGAADEYLKLSTHGRCHDYAPSTLSATQRLRGRNLERLHKAASYLAPGFDAHGNESPLQILADYQEVLERARPDTMLAGVYLGLVATVPITEAVVEDVNLILCVTSSHMQAGAIVEIAVEQERVGRR